MRSGRMRALFRVEHVVRTVTLLKTWSLPIWWWWLLWWSWFSNWQEFNDQSIRNLEERKKDLFWKIWKGEYLLSLREKITLIHKQLRTSYSGKPKEGDIVIVKDDKHPRSSWKLGKILKLISSRDLKVTVAQIHLPGHSTITRAINYFFPIRIKSITSTTTL